MFRLSKMTFSWEVDDTDAFRTMVKREIKCLGVRISKKKDAVKAGQTQVREEECVGVSLFGRALNTYCLVKDEPSLCLVPRFLRECTKFLGDHLNNEGIFRVSGSKARQRELQHTLENGSYIPVDANAANVCSLFKQFFRNLPDPLLTPPLQSALLKSMQLANAEERQWVVLNICYLLPPLNIQILRFLMLFLHKVASKSEHNRMDASNLAKIFAPNLMGTFGPADKKNPDKVIAMQCSVIEIMIQNAKLIGEVPEWMMDKVQNAGHNRSRDHLDRLTSEDELEKSDDNLEESSRPERRLRRKSGGSFQVLVNGLGHSLGILKTGLSSESILTDVSHCADSPKIMKRKANDDLGTTFTSTKRKALLHKMTVDPQYSKPGLHLHKSHSQEPSTPETCLPLNPPALRETDAITTDGETFFRFGTPSIVYADESFAGHTPSKLGGSQMTAAKTNVHGQETPKSKLKKFKERSAKKLKRKSIALHLDGESLITKSSKGMKTPVNKRKETNDVGWRLANASPPEGGLDTMKLFEQTVRPSPNFSRSSLNRPRRHVKVPSSPARLLTGVSSSLTQSPPQTPLDGHGNASMSTPVRESRAEHSPKESPKVVIVDTCAALVESPKVVVVETVSDATSFTKEYIKNQQAHTSKLIGSKLGTEHISPSRHVSESTKQKIKAAENVYVTMSLYKVEDSAGTGVSCAGQKSLVKQELVTDKSLKPSVSQVSLSSVLSGISACSHRSDFSNFSVDALISEKQPQTTDMETIICSPCVVECRKDTHIASECSMENEHDGMIVTDTNILSAGAEVSRDCNDGIPNSCPIEPDSFICCDGQEAVYLSQNFKDNARSTSEEAMKEICECNSQYLISERESPMKDLKDADSEQGKNKMNQHADRTDDFEVGNSKTDGRLEDVSESCEVERNAEERFYENDQPIIGQDMKEIIESPLCKILAESYSMDTIKTKQPVAETGKETVQDELQYANCDKSESSNDIPGDSLSTEGYSHDECESPKCVDVSKPSVDVQRMINAALKSDLIKPTPGTSLYPQVDSMAREKDKHISSIVKTNIQLFNSFSTVKQEQTLMNHGSQQRMKARVASNAELLHSRARTPLTKSISMDSGICNIPSSGTNVSGNKDLSNSYLMAIKGNVKRQIKSDSASTVEILSPKQECSRLPGKALKSHYSLRGSQSMQDISTPSSEEQSSSQHAGIAVQSIFTPKRREDNSSPRSIKRRQPVSHFQKVAFQESTALTQHRIQKRFDVEENHAITPLVKPLGDNNAPHLRTTRRPVPLDPRRTAPLIPIHMAQRTRLRTQGNRKTTFIKHRSPMKPIKRLGKSPSPARSKNKYTPE